MGEGGENKIPVKEQSVPDTVASGRNITTADILSATDREKKPITLTNDDLQPGELTPGATEIVLQRHGKYIRDKEDPHVGSLTEQAIADETTRTQAYFDKLLNRLTPEQQAKTYFLFTASDTSFAGGGPKTGGGRRSYETAVIAQKAAEAALKARGISTDNVLNLSHKLKGLEDNDKLPRPLNHLREPQVFDNSWDFVKILMDKYGDGKLNTAVFQAFERDLEKETRLAMKAEGPEDIADRTARAVRITARFARLFHEANPDSILVAWEGTHYDTISPFTKRVLGEPLETDVFVDYGAGLVIDIDPKNNNQGTTKISGQTYPVAI